MREKVQFNFAARWEAEMATVFAPKGSFRRPNRIIVLGVSGGIALLVLAGLPWIYQSKLNYNLQSVNQKTSDLLAVELKIKQLNDLKAKVQTQKRFLDTVKNENYDPIIVLNQLKSLLPAGTVVSSFTFGSDKKVNISLAVTGPLDLARLWLSLQNSGVFQGVNIQSVSLEDQVQNLTLSLTYSGTMSLHTPTSTPQTGDPTQPVPPVDAGDSTGGTVRPTIPPGSKPVIVYPGIPRNVSATLQGTDKVVISWDDALSAVSYNVYRSIDPKSGYIKIANVATLYFEDTELTSPLTYYYKVSSVNKSGTEGYFDHPVSVNGSSSGTGNENNLEAPSGLTTMPYGSGQVSVSWNKVSSAGGYKVYRAESVNGPFVIVGIVTETNMLDTDMPAGIYFYRVSSLSEAFEGPASVTQNVNLVNGRPE